MTECIRNIRKQIIDSHFSDISKKNIDNAPNDLYMRTNNLNSNG